jgi:hypothetical protein
MKSKGSKITWVVPSRYLADRVTQERLSGCLAAFWLREYSWAFAQASRGNRREEIETQLETAAKKLLQF